MLHRYAYVVLPVEGEPSIVFPKEARWVGDHGEVVDRGQGLRRAPRAVDRRSRLQADRRLRPRLRDAGPRLPAARRRRRGLGPGLRHCPCGQVRGGARLGRGELPVERGRCPRRARRLRGRQDRGRGDGRGRARLLRRRHVAHDDGHGADRRRTARPAPSSSIRTPRGGSGRTTWSSTASRSPPSAATGSSSRARSVPARPARPRSRRWTRTRSTSTPRRATMKAGNTAHDVHTAVSKGFLDRGFKLGHVTGHSIGMTMIEFPRIGEGNEFVLRDEHGDLDAPARDHPGRRCRASTCRTRGGSLLRAGCRSRGCRSGSSARARSSGDSEFAAAGQPARQEEQHARHEGGDDDGAPPGAEVQPRDRAGLGVGEERDRGR